MAEEPRLARLSVIVFSGDFDRVHYALSLAAAAAAVNTPATLFFTMGAIRALLADVPTGEPGWHNLAPGESGMSPRAREAHFAAHGVATFAELLSACGELGVRFMVCEMGLRAVGLAKTELRRDLTIAEGGIVTFLAEASGTGQVLFV